MFLLAALAATLAPVPANQAQARATVRVARAVEASKAQWAQVPPSRRRERVVIEAGKRLTLRLIEME